jgi:anti-sigma factor RsiW
MMNAHPTREEDFDLYALGALEGEEKQALDRHFSECRACTQKLAEARTRVAMFILAAPTVEPSPEVKQRLLAQVRSADQSAASAPVRAAFPRTARATEEQPPAFAGWWTAILAPAAVALALISVFLWRQNVRLDQQLAEQRAALAQQQSQIDAAQKALAVYNGESQARTAVWTGWISDNHCGARGMAAAHKECAMKCIKEMNSYWVFVDSKSKSIVKIHNQDGVNPESSLGAEMKVTGWMMDDGTLQVSNISASR